MAISCTCECGKALRLKDEWVGKQAKCPGCGITFLVPAMGGPVRALQTVGGGAEMWGSRQRPQEKEGVGASISMSPMMITWIVIAIAVPVIILLIKIGPVAAQKKWTAMQDEVESNITSVVTRAIQSQARFNTAESRHAPGVQAVTMDANVIMYVPEWVRFSGRSTNGMFNGRYNTKTGEVEADVPMFLSKNLMHVTGRVKNGATEAEVDGKEAKVIFIKKTKEEMD
ncbi:MAG TPA: hypothetical protein VF669_14390 [Tepidisphaeraceae bacterium]|jgi:hypothetical protein